MHAPFAAYRTRLVVFHRPPFVFLFVDRAFALLDTVVIPHYVWSYKMFGQVHTLLDRWSFQFRANNFIFARVKSVPRSFSTCLVSFVCSRNESIEYENLKQIELLRCTCEDNYCLVIDKFLVGFKQFEIFTPKCSTFKFIDCRYFTYSSWCSNLIMTGFLRILDIVVDIFQQ